MAAATIVLPLATLAVLVIAWGGLVPPRWTEVHVAGQFITMAGAVYSFAVVGLFGPPFLLAIGGLDRAVIKRHVRWVGGAFVVGILLAITTPSNFDESAGRWGGYLWEAARALPTISGRSLVFLALTPAGAVTLACLGAQLAERSGKRIATFWVGSFLAWCSTAAANRVAFHRYYEPPILVFLILWALLMVEDADRKLSVKVRFLYVTAAAQLAITIATAHVRTFVPTN